MMKIMRIIGYSIFSIWFLGAITLSFENGNFTPLILPLIILIILIYRKISKNKHLKLQNTQQLDNAMNYFETINKTHRIPPISTDIMLDRNEEAYLDETTQLYEPRSIRKSRGVGFRVMKGVYAGGSESKSHYELTKIADGELILTNKRLVFVSSMHNRTFSLDKIFSVRGYTDSIEVSTEGSKKGHIFAVLTPMIWENLIKILKQIDNSANVPQINVKFE